MSSSDDIQVTTAPTSPAAAAQPETIQPDPGNRVDARPTDAQGSAGEAKIPSADGTPVKADGSTAAQAARATTSAPGGVRPDISTAPSSFLRDYATRIIAKRIVNAEPTPPVVPAPSRKAAPTRQTRFPLLAAAIALAATLGAAAGSLGAAGLAQVLPLSEGPARRPVEPSGIDSAADAAALKTVIAQLAAEVAALKASVEQSGRTTAQQLARTAERIDRPDRAQAEQAAKIAKILEGIERLERRAAASLPAREVTGSIAAAGASAVDAKPLPVIDRYVLRQVYDGIALLEGRRGMIEVEPGVNLPGAGRVEEIRRQDGRWVVVTTKGLILPVR
jgi:hypothetical protein